MKVRIVVLKNNSPMCVICKHMNQIVENKVSFCAGLILQQLQKDKLVSFADSIDKFEAAHSTWLKTPSKLSEIPQTKDGSFSSSIPIHAIKSNQHKNGNVTVAQKCLDIAPIFNTKSEDGCFQYEIEGSMTQITAKYLNDSAASTNQYDCNHCIRVSNFSIKKKCTVTNSVCHNLTMYCSVVGGDTSHAKTSSTTLSTRRQMFANNFQTSDNDLTGKLPWHNLNLHTMIRVFSQINNENDDSQQICEVSRLRRQHRP